jgi:serine kinase of HPr protein (carbohydrate metabolism regulator)
MSTDAHLRQVSVQRLFDDIRERTGLTWIAGRQGGNRILTGEAALKPTIGQVGHMNFIHPFRVQMMGARSWRTSAACRRISCSRRSSACSRSNWSPSSSPTARPSPTC